MEEIILTDGLVRNASFTDYLLPTMLDMPTVVATLIEHPDPMAPTGRQGRRRATVHLVDAGDRRRHPRRDRPRPLHASRCARRHLPAIALTNPHRSVCDTHGVAANTRSARLAAVANEREIMTWEMFGEASRDLSQMVADDYEPDMILSIARGGLLIGGAMGYALSVKNVYTMNVEFYTGVDERLEVPRILPPAPDFVDVSDARILIADDVADTGHTLRSVQQFCEGKVAEVRTAVLYEKSHSVVQCDYVWRRTDKWINFPWSDKAPVAKRALVRQGCVSQRLRRVVYPASHYASRMQ